MQPATTTLQRYFTGLAECVFQTHLGVADVSLIDYLSTMLVRFVRIDAIHKVRNLSGRPMTEVAEMLVEANVRLGIAKREVHRHIGDFTLFWAGVYPEALREMRSPRRKDHFIDYCSHGKMAYHIASTIETDEQNAPQCDILERLSQNFEMCAYGLREVRREWERRDNEDLPRPLLID